ncbi:MULTISPECIES: recombinase family protein [Comamonas]|uniref:recombinase family protein n=1 Tax=Comamonas TaxID=283 RepID=UPI0001BB19B1|nr:MULTISPECIES: recombinase family protein [Comamonas]ACY34559.1 Resolvase-like protein [Comamonas thiooxydans]MDO1475699.1 recombinase family protein [Comamonas thiooxydans]MEB5963811.1 recombinase family protein [Comamonas testosteroni]
MAEIGYARVSTHEQSLDLQRDELKRVGAEVIYEDCASGKTAERPELQHCLKALRAGDTLTVWRLDRLGRNLQDLIRIVTELEAKGVTFKSLKESIDTRGPAGKLVFHMFGALAQFERELLRERTMAGLDAARSRGRKGGRPPSLSPAQKNMALSLIKSGDLGISEIGKQFGVSRSTLYNLMTSSRNAA